MIIILHTKLLIPQSGERNLLARSELFRLLGEGLCVKLTVVMAPAGYGKTTALSMWARQNSCSTVWLSLDQFDNDLVRFWRYVIEAIRTVYPEFTRKVVAQLESAGEDTIRQSIDDILNELHSLSSDLALVLDDFHVIDQASIQESVAYFLEYLPSNVHIFIASRTAPAFPSARLLAKGEMQSVSVKELRFQLEDGVQYFRDCMNIRLSMDDAAMFVDRTEGWVSGLHLAAISLKNDTDSSEFIRGFSGQYRDVAQYLLEEVLERQSTEMINFLLKTSVLSRMNVSLCMTVTGQAGTQSLLEQLERQQLFITKLDERGEWYRYHHLFADFLQQQCLRMLPEEWERVHANAARWLEANGELEEAVEHWMACGRCAEAARLIEQRISELQDRRGSLVRWLEAMPDKVLRKRPFLQLLFLKMKCEAGQVHWVDRQLRDLENELSAAEWQPWLGSYYFLSAETALYGRNIPQSLHYLELFDQLEHTSAGSRLQMSAGNTLSGVNIESLLSFFDSFYDAEKYLLTCIRIWEGKGNTPFLGYFYYFYSGLLYEWNRTDEAETLVKRMLFPSVWQPYTRIWFFSTVTLAQIQLIMGETEKAFTLMDQIEDQFDTLEKDLFMRRLEAEKVYFSILVGLTDQVEAWIGSCGLKHSDRVPPSYREYYILARALTEVGQTSEALILLEEILRLTQQKDWLWDQVKVMILQSMALDRHGNEEEALKKLETALHLSEPQGYVRSYVDEGKALGHLLTRYLQYRQNGSIRSSMPVPLLYVKRLLNNMNVELEGTLAIRSVLTDQEIRIVRLIEQGCKNREIADSLGISAETVKKHIKNIYQKLKAHNRVQAVSIAKKLRLI